MSGNIVVINPNSSVNVTEAMDRALDPLRAGGAQILSVTNPNGPPGIENQSHVDGVSSDICDIVRDHDTGAAAFVIACYSDPGMYAAREITDKPVYGIAECGMLTALSMGSSFGVIAILSRSIPRHLRYIRSLGLINHLAGDLAIELGVTELADEGKTFGRMVEVGETLRDAHGAETLVMGCAGMARYRSRLEEAVGIPVIDPCQAAVGMALTRLHVTQGLLEAAAD